MPTDTERRLEALENLALFGGGVAASTAAGRQLVGAAARRAPMAASRFVGKHPAATVIALGYTAHRLGLGPIETAELIAEELAQPALETTPGTPQFFKKEKRKISKANKAVKHAMGLLKAGTKRSTGADKGKLPKGAFKIAVKAAGLANPRTRSVIGKGKGKVKILARKIRKWW
jgi:hypothetical protein